MEVAEENIQCTPPEIKKKSLETSFEILPRKSAEKYYRQYDLFMEWCKKYNIIKYSENALLAYFADLSKEYSPSTLWSYYSMIKATLSAKNNINISQYKKLTAFLKQKGRSYIPKKSRTLSQEDILNFLINAPDNTYLMMKICVLFGISGALRNEEFSTLRLSDIDHKDTILVIRINKTKTNKPRMFVITETFEGKINTIQLYEKYLSLRPEHTPHDRFFINYKNAKCTIQPIGVHTFGKMPKKIAMYLGLSEPLLYTGHCFRRTSATLFANGGGSKENLKRHGGWKSDSIAESYVEESILNKTKIANTILGESQTIDIGSNPQTFINNNSTQNLRFVNIDNNSNILINDNNTQDIPFTSEDNNSHTFSLKTPSTSQISFFKPSNCSFTFNITNNNTHYK